VRIYRRGKVYWAQLHGRQFSLKTTDREAAELAFRIAQRQAVDPTYRAPDQTSLAVALERFEAQQTQRGRAAGTVKQYGVHASHLARVLGADAALASIAAPEVDHYLATRHAEGASSQTQWKELCTLRGALKLARRHGSYPHALDTVMPHAFEGASSTPRDGHLTLDQVGKLVATLPPERAAVVAFIAATAADWRSVELARPGDIDLKAGTALVRGSKNEHRWRTVPILPPFKKWATLAAGTLARGPFAPWGNVRRDLEVACRAAGVPYATPRDLRRSHAKALRAAGVEPHLIGKMLGHADSRMVERVYGQLAPEALAALMRGRTQTPVRQRKAKKSPKPRKKAARRKSTAD
jgi:integrase